MRTHQKRVFKRSILVLLTVTMVTALLFPIPAFAEDAPPAEPVVTETPADNPPADNPPADNPPADNPPADNPPADNPPADNPPADNPPTEDPPAENPPTEDPPAETPPAEEEVPEYMIPEGSAYIEGAEDVVYENDGTSNAIQKAVDEALKSGKESVTIVVKNGVYSGGVVIIAPEESKDDETEEPKTEEPKSEEPETQELETEEPEGKDPDEDPPADTTEEKKKLILNIIAEDAYEVTAKTVPTTAEAPVVFRSKVD